MRETGNWTNRPFIWTDKKIEAFKKMFYEEMRSQAEITDWFKMSPYSIREMFREKNFPNRINLSGRAHRHINFRWREYENEFQDRSKNKIAQKRRSDALAKGQL